MLSRDTEVIPTLTAHWVCLFDSRLTSLGIRTAFLTFRLPFCLSSRSYACFPQIIDKRQMELMFNFVCTLIALLRYDLLWVTHRQIATVLRRLNRSINMLSCRQTTDHMDIKFGKWADYRNPRAGLYFRHDLLDSNILFMEQVPNIRRQPTDKLKM